MKLARASILFAGLVFYLASAFQLSHERFWTRGLGDWKDPYFINYLLEHWRSSAWHVTDPSSPPMYFPTRGTLGYSHGLILYAAYYLAVRPFLDPFQAYNLTIFLVLVSGITCLYVVLRMFLRLSFVESLLLSAVFLSSPNVTDGSIGVWSQRASVFLIPAILLIFLASARMRPGRPRIVLACVSGLLSTLLYTQDFHTGQFALLFLIVGCGPALLLARASLIKSIAEFWNAERSVSVKLVILTAALATIWTFYVLMFGGGSVQILDLRLTSHDWWRPAMLALISAAVWIWLRGGGRITAVLERMRPFLPFGVGAFMGALVFLWIYLGAYQEHGTFSHDEIVGALFQREPSGWHSFSAFIADLHGYDSLRSFALVFVLTILAWAPRSGADRITRLYCLWGLLISVVVLIVPFRFGEFSIWRTLVEPLPGFAAIRDPKRIIYVFELAAVLATSVLLTRLPKHSPLRISTVPLLVVLLIAEPHRVIFDFLRPNDAYARWVETSIDIEPACQSFYIKGASSEYTSRPDSDGSIYAIDAMFVSLNHSIPTLNGYSAWAPDGWNLANPDEPSYAEAVRDWIERHNLQGVCELDIEARTMKLSTPISAAPTGL